MLFVPKKNVSHIYVFFTLEKKLFLKLRGRLSSTKNKGAKLETKQDNINTSNNNNNNNK